jgi:hypothetical protein
MTTDSESANLASENSANAIVLKRSEKGARSLAGPCQREVSKDAIPDRSGKICGEIFGLALAMAFAVALSLAGVTLVRLLGVASLVRR